MSVRLTHVNDTEALGTVEEYSHPLRRELDSITNDKLIKQTILNTFKAPV